MFFVQPIIVEFVKQPEPTRDISVDVVIGIFAMAGVALLVAAIGSLIVGGVLVAIRRHRDASAPPTSETGHVRLGI